MGPYRTPAPPPPPPDPPRPREEQILAWMTLGLGGLRVGVTLAQHQRFSAEPTLAVGLASLGLAALVRDWHQRRRHRRR